MKKHKMLLLLTYYILLIFVTLAHSACVHDQIRSKFVPRKHVLYEDTHHEHIIQKRDNGGHPGPIPGFRKIRIHCDFEGLDERLDRTQRDMVTSILRDAVSKVTNIFTVKPVQGNLLLPRSPEACAREWANGPNEGECAKLSGFYTGEKCLEGLPVIPQDHVVGLKEWDYSEGPTRVKFEEGKGLPNTDFVLYIRSVATDICANNPNVMAYATYCHQDQDGRPISGMVNLCPSVLTRTDKDIETKRMTVLHEIFHALGFSSDLFKHFRDCSRGTCTPYHDPVRNIDSVPRLVTPHAVLQTTQHFGCFEAGKAKEFGPVLQREASNIKSHWDAAFMYGSIMAPTIEVGHLTIVDPITLAVFEDSGWYGIDYYYADRYDWGKGGGCEFAIHGNCDSDKGSKFFCEGSRIGCHYLHQDKGQCKSDQFLIDCRVYKASLEDTCAVNKQDEKLPGEIFGSDSKCFMSNVNYRGQSTSSLKDGRCFRHRCKERRRQEIQLENSIWYDCPPGGQIQIPGFDGVVECPDIDILCKPPKPPKPMLPDIGHAPPPMYPDGKEEKGIVVLCIELIFRYEFRDLWRNNLLDRFKKEVSSEIKKRTHCAEGRITGVDVFDADQVATAFRFYLGPAQDTMDGPESDMVYKVLSSHVSARNFTVFLPQPVYAESIRTIPLDPTKSDKGIAPGIIAAIVVVLAIIAVVIGVMVFFVQRYYALQDRIRQNDANYPNPRYSDLNDSERRDSDPSVHTDVEGSYSDRASYHSDIDGYPVSIGPYTSKWESLHSDVEGVDNLAYSCGSKGSVTSSSSAAPSVTYISTINVKGADKNDPDERVKIANTDASATDNPERKISCNSDETKLPQKDVHSNGLVNGVSDMCNEPIPHHEDDVTTVTTIGIRDRTSSEITISTIRARRKLEERKRVKSQDDVNVKPASHRTDIVPLHKARFSFVNPLSNRDSTVTISTVSSKDRSMSDVTISTLSKNSVYMGSYAHIPNGGGELNNAFVKDNSVLKENRFSNVTLSTVLSGDQTFSEDENDSVFIKEDPTRKISQSSDDVTVTKGNEIKTSQEKPAINGADSVNDKEKQKSKMLNRTGSMQSKTSEISCSHNHENHHKKRSSGLNLNGIGNKVRTLSSSSESSLTSNDCSECDSCPYCRDCASVISDGSENNNNASTKFVSVVNT